MKTILFTIGLTIWGMCAFSQNIPNGNFEDWEIDISTGIEEPVGFVVPNNLVVPAGLPFSVTKASGADASEGDYAVRLETVLWPITGDTVPASILLDEAGFGTPVSFSEQPIVLKGFHKGSVASDSETGILLIFFNNNSPAPISIGSAEVFFTGSAGSYMPFEVPIDWFTTEVPSRILLTVYTSGNGQEVLGDTYYVDGLSFGTSTGIDIPLSSAIEPVLYPNPGKNIVYINMQQDNQNPSLCRIYDESGKLLRTISPEADGGIDLNGLPNGLLLLETFDKNQQMLKSFRFVKAE